MTNFVVAECGSYGYYSVTFPKVRPQKEHAMNIGETIRNYRLQKSMSQGDIEKRTGLLRCYLSRVENGHTIPSLDTLAKIAGSMEIPLAQFFSDSAENGAAKAGPQLTEDEVRFLSQIRRYSPNLNDSDRKLVIAMVKKMAVGK
jgi:transcriptional regulator with XRE-family HTH domain